MAPCSPPGPGANQEEEQLLSLMGQGQTCQGIRSDCENFCHSHTFPSFTCQQTLTLFSVQTSDFLLSIRDVLTRTDLLGTVKKALESSPNPMIHQKTHRKTQIIKTTLTTESVGAVTSTGGVSLPATAT